MTTSPRNMFCLIRNKDHVIAEDTSMFIQFHFLTCKSIDTLVGITLIRH